MEYYLHFGEGTLQPHLVSLLVGSIAVQKVPWPASFLASKIISRINSSYYEARLLMVLKFLDSQLEEENGGCFVDDTLTAADIILDFSMSENVFGGRLGAVGVDIDRKTQFPNLYKWHQFTTALPSRIRAVAREKTVVSNQVMTGQIITDQAMSRSR